MSKLRNPTLYVMACIACVCFTQSLYKKKERNKRKKKLRQVEDIVVPKQNESICNTNTLIEILKEIKILNREETEIGSTTLNTHTL